MAKTVPSLLRPRNADEHARVTYAELFFDLVFVFAVTQLSHVVLKHPDGPGLLHAAVLLLAVSCSEIYTALIASADAISAARPGARRETLEKYIKRMEELESLASGFPGVQQAYAIQAGREVRVIADARSTTDKQAAKVCRDIARAIERQLTYPGEIKVTVVREMRVVDYAR